MFFRLQNDKYDENVNKSFSKIWSQSFGGGPSVRKNIALPNQKMKPLVQQCSAVQKSLKTIIIMPKNHAYMFSLSNFLCFSGYKMINMMKM